MAVFDFWKSGKLNRLISKLKEDFQEEIRDFGHFKELQTKKIDIIKKIREVWNYKLKKAEELVTKYIPLLIKRQLEFIEIDIGYIDEEDFILQYFIKIEERRNTILGHYINNNINPDYLEAVRNQGKRKFAKINEAIRENSTALKKECLAALEENLNKQLRFFERNDSWSAINQNQELLEDLNKEQELTQKVENVVKDIVIKIKEIVGFELRQPLISRRRFVGYSAAGLIWAFLSEGKTAQAEASIVKTVRPNKNLKKGEPKINIRIFYGSHDTTEDAIAINKEFQKADVYIPEIAGWTENTLFNYRKISAGVMTPEAYYGPHDTYFDYEEYKMIYKSGKLITLIDIPQASPINQRRLKLKEPTISYSESFEDALRLYKEYYEEHAANIKERENFMLSQLRKFIKDLRESIKKNPKLFSKDKLETGITILIFIGSVHTRVSHYAKREFPKNSSRTFAKKPLIFHIGNEILRRNLFGKKVSKELLAAKLFEVIFLSSLLHGFWIGGENPDLRRIVFFRMIIKNFTFDEIKNIYGAIQKQGIDKRFKIIRDSFYQKGIKLPQTPEEFTNMLPRYAR